jgi:hypothetical protein
VLTLRPSGSVQQHVHRAQSRDAVHQLELAQSLLAQMSFLIQIESVVRCDAMVDREQEAARPTCGSQITSPGRGATQSTRTSISTRGVKYCPAPLFVSAAFFSSRPLISVALDIGRHRGPVLLADKFDDELAHRRIARAASAWHCETPNGV